MNPYDKLPDPSAKAPFRHPVIYTALIVPFGAVGGFVGVALNFIATQVGLTVEDGAKLIAVGMIPHTWKALWAPVVDTTFTRKKWYVGSCLICVVGSVLMAAIPLGPSTFYVIAGIIFVTNLATTTLGMAVEGLMAHLTPPEERGRVGGWFQAGNLGGNGVGGGLGLWMLKLLPAPWMSGAILGGSYLLGMSLLRYLPDVPAEPFEGGPVAAVRGVLKDMWDVVRSQSGLLCAVLCFLPIGTGAAAGVLGQAEVAAVWGVGENEVALVNGLLSGAISAFGCLVGGVLCGKWHARKVYVGIGVLMAVVTGAMAIAPYTPACYIGFGLAYSFVTGLAYAAFTGFVLDAIGAGAAATKYNVFAMLSNIPIMYMGLVLASAFTAYGAKGLLFGESGAGILGIGVLAVFGLLVRGMGGAKVAAAK